jgi:altronate dehydratase small subunit
MNNKRQQAIICADNDDVAVALFDLKAGQTVEMQNGESKLEIRVIDDIKYLHKFALHDIKKGKNVIKYGQSIGLATTDIKKGENVHTHNLKGFRLK